MGAKIENRPAFDGAKFDKQGYCINHPTCQLTAPFKSDGKLMYEELKRNCPSCISDKNKSKRSTSLGGGKAREGHVHGTPRSSMQKRSSSRSKKPTQKPRREYDTPFDDKGRCHYHKTVQLAAKKMGGGWKVLHKACPKCMEDKYENDGDDRSVKSSSSKKSTGTSKSAIESAQGQFDRNGCCVLHTHIQVAKKKVLGGWKVVRSCPACSGEDDIGLDDDRISVCSKSSRKSTRSASSRSVKSARSTKSSKSQSRPGQAAKSSRYGVLPFDGDGYCCQHPSVLLAQKKMMGGWKIIHDVCPECADELGGSKHKKKASRRKSGSGRLLDASGSDASSIKSGKSGSSPEKKKRIRVKNLKTEDENGKHGRYTGDVNDDYRPNGNGTMRYDDGTVYEGVWSEGSQAHGTMKRKQSKF